MLIRFDVVDWNAEGAQDRSLALAQAQSAASGGEWSEESTAAFESLAPLIAGILEAMGVAADSIVQLSVSGDSREDGTLFFSLSLNAGPRTSL